MQNKHFLHAVPKVISVITAKVHLTHRKCLYMYRRVKICKAAPSEKESQIESNINYDTCTNPSLYCKQSSGRHMGVNPIHISRLLDLIYAKYDRGMHFPRLTSSPDYSL